MLPKPWKRASLRPKGEDMEWSFAEAIPMEIRYAIGLSPLRHMGTWKGTHPMSDTSPMRGLTGTIRLSIG